MRIPYGAYSKNTKISRPGHIHSGVANDTDRFFGILTYEIREALWVGFGGRIIGSCDTENKLADAILLEDAECRNLPPRCPDEDPAVGT